MNRKYNKKGQKKPKRLPRVPEWAETVTMPASEGICKEFTSNIPKETEGTNASPLEFFAKIHKKYEKYLRYKEREYGFR